jgi:hypothetical protein
MLFKYRGIKMAKLMECLSLFVAASLLVLSSNSYVYAKCIYGTGKVHTMGVVYDTEFKNGKIVHDKVYKKINKYITQNFSKICITGNEVRSSIPGLIARINGHRVYKKDRSKGGNVINYYLEVSKKGDDLKVIEGFRMPTGKKGQYGGKSENITVVKLTSKRCRIMSFSGSLTYMTSTVFGNRYNLTHPITCMLR